MNYIAYLPNYTKQKIMKNFKTNHFKMFIATIVVASIFGIQNVFAQDISVYQYRKVDNDKVDEFIKRETEYWSKVAQKAVDDGKLKFWALFQKVGGYDLDNTSNFLFINTFADIDATDGIWDASAVFPDTPMEEIETYSMSRNTSLLFVRAHHFEMAEGANPQNDFKYVSMIYHDAPSPNELVELEKEHWAPFIKAAMDNGQTTQKGWGNSVILSPSGPDMKYNTISYDLYPSLKETLSPTMSDDIQFPQYGLTLINELERTRRSSVIYKIVKIIDAN